MFHSIYRAPVFTEEILGGENGEGEVVQPPERSLLAKYVSSQIGIKLIVLLVFSINFL